MARPGRQERNRTARSFRQLTRFHHGINSDEVFGTHRRIDRQEPTSTRQSRESNSSAISSRSTAKTWKRSGKTSVVPRLPVLSSWTNDLGIFGFRSSIASASSNSEKRAHWREPAP